MQMFLQQTEVLKYGIDGADDNFCVGSIPFFVEGGYINNSVDLHTIGITGQTSSLPLYLQVMEGKGLDCSVVGHIPLTSSIDMHTVATDVKNLGVDMYVENYPNTLGVDLFCLGSTTATMFNTIDMFVTTDSDTVFTSTNSIDMVVFGPNMLESTTGIDFYLENGDNVVHRAIDFFLLNEWSDIHDSIRMYVKGDGFADGYVPFGGTGINLYIERLPAEKIDLFLKVIDGQLTGNIHMSIVGVVNFASGINLVAPNVYDVIPQDLSLYTHGF